MALSNTIISLPEKREKIKELSMLREGELRSLKLMDLTPRELTVLRTVRKKFHEHDMKLPDFFMKSLMKHTKNICRNESVYDEDLWERRIFYALATDLYGKDMVARVQKEIRGMKKEVSLPQGEWNDLFLSTLMEFRKDTSSMEDPLKSCLVLQKSLLQRLKQVVLGKEG